MIRHICMFKLKEENRKANIAEFVDRAQVLKELEMVKRFEVVTNSEDAPESNYEVSLIIDFESWEDLDAYQTAPTHIEFAKFVGLIREDRACIDYIL